MIAETILPEFDNEMRTTRALLERVPEKDANWKPHPKSRTIGQLASHVANLPGLMTVVLTATEFDALSPTRERLPDDMTTTEALLQRFDANISAARAAIAGTNDAEFQKLWTLRAGDHVVFTVPRAGAARVFVMNHLIHHRGQLSVYLRQREVPLPSIYGPTADLPL